MSKHPDGTVAFEADGRKYQLYFGFRAIAAMEAHYDLPFFQALRALVPSMSAEELAAASGDSDAAARHAANAKAAMSFRFGEIQHVFGFALLHHHRDLTQDEVIDLIEAIGFMRAAELMWEALNAVSTSTAEAGAADGRPPVRRGGRTG